MAIRGRPYSSSRHRHGTLADLLKSHRSNGKILNALNFPMPLTPHPPSSFSSYTIAFAATTDLQMCHRCTELPSHTTHWGLACTKHSSHKCHIDMNGLGTYIDVQDSAKLWIVLTPKNPVSEMDIKLFLEDYSLDSISLEKWNVEAVVLQCGAQL
jgi:hypothetical protein